MIDTKEVKWVVNTLAELGVKIGNQFFWLYKGESLVYTDEDKETAPIKWRYVEKREFGETCRSPLIERQEMDAFVESFDWNELPKPDAPVVVETSADIAQAMREQAIKLFQLADKLAK